MEDDIFVFFENSESEVVRRIKNERINRGRDYLDYLSPAERLKHKKRNIFSFNELR